MEVERGAMEVAEVRGAEKDWDVVEVAPESPLGDLEVGVGAVSEEMEVWGGASAWVSEGTEHWGGAGSEGRGVDEMLMWVVLG